MTVIQNLPSYEELFGALDFKKGDEARSVYSPAAYLADLLQLIDDFFEQADLKDRRADIRGIPLNGKNTYTPIPYLDIVIELLEEATAEEGRDAYTVLREALYPFNLPFNLDNEKLKKYLHFLKVSPEKLYQAFAQREDPQRTAREALGLSEEEYRLVTEEKTVDRAYLKAYYNFDTTEVSPMFIPVATFMKLTGLSGPELRQLLFGNLSGTAQNPAGEVERERAAELFIHAGLGGYARLDEQEENIVWNAAETPIPAAWFDRVNRFVRLARKIAMPLTDLDLILRTCCDNLLNTAAMEILAVVHRLGKQTELPVEAVCALLADINTLGIGDEDEPKDFFNRLFNVRYAELSREYLAPGKGAAVYTPRAYRDFTTLTTAGDLLAPESKPFRRRIAKALQLSEKDLVAIVQRFRDRNGENGPTLFEEDAEIGLPALSLLFRLSKLSELLDISVEEIFALFDIFEDDPSLRQVSNFNLLIDPHPAERDCYKMIAGEDRRDLLWLIQMLFAVTEWMRRHDFTAAELQKIVAGGFRDEKEAEKARQQKIAALDSLYQQLKPLMLQPQLFVSPRFDERAARIIHRVISADGSPLVSPEERRLLRYEPAAARQAAAEALGRFDILHHDDFIGLNVSGKMLDKIVNNLIFRGYLDLEGRLIEKNFPTSPGKFAIEGDFSLHQHSLFKIIHRIYLDEKESLGEAGDRVDISLFPSDLSDLNLPEAEAGELYDNLIFNGYLDEDGNVLHADFFAELANQENFRVNAGIGDYSEPIHTLISEQLRRFEKEELAVTPALFEGLGLSDAETGDLLENLRFNGYLDDKNQVRRKKELLALDVQDFHLALQFYPERHQILGSLQELTADFQNRFYRFTREHFAGLAEEIVSQMACDHLSHIYCHEGRIKPENRAFFSDSSNLSQFSLPSYFDNATRGTVFNAVAGYLKTAEKYQLTTETLTALGLEEDRPAEVIAWLRGEGYIDAHNRIPAERLAYFLNINQALNFRVEDFEDYNKDIFFALNRLARETEAAISAVDGMLSGLVERQEETLFSALQEIFEIPAGVLEVTCREVFRQPPSIVEEWMLPLLKSASKEDRIDREPASHPFNFAYRRIARFARLAARLRLDERETGVVFKDQSLVEKYPEKLVLPENLDGFDALLELPMDLTGMNGFAGEGRLDLVCLFRGNRYWAYSAANYDLLIADAPLTKISAKFSGISRVDAAFTDEDGAAWIIAGEQYFCRKKDSEVWEKKQRNWGKIRTNFGDPEQIDAAFTDSEGKTYLFAGDQYVRYSAGYQAVDSGYPKKIRGNWKRELEFQLPPSFAEAIDASFQATDDKTYLFRGNTFIASDDSLNEIDIREMWGKIKNNFPDARQIDAAFVYGHKVYLVAGDQLLSYRNHLENDGVLADEGSLRSLSFLPEKLREGIEAGFRGYDGKIHLFREGRYCASQDGLEFGEDSATADSWGRVRNTLQETGRVDAAFSGLDGRSYLFCGDQYLRYSGQRYARVDEGYPRSIARDWGGLEQVDAAFVLDGKTYLFGKYRDPEDPESLRPGYVRYSGSDYSTPDEGYPRTPNDNWWNLPATLIDAGFATPDTVFIGREGNAYLFSGNQFIRFDARHRWWSEPQSLAEHWDSLPFEQVDAAFTGKDGRTYLFGGDKFVRYSDENYSKIDDRFPKTIREHWGKVRNNIAKTGRIDAALVLVSRIPREDGEGSEEIQHTYLFSGDQFYRYTAPEGHDWSSGYPEWVEEGYPKTIKTALKKEPRFHHLPDGFENGVDAAFADRRTIYLFKGDRFTAISETLYREYPALTADPVTCAFIDRGTVYAEINQEWQQMGNPEGKALAQTPLLPPPLREVPEEFRQGLSALLKGRDGNTYLFKEGSCYNRRLEKSYPLNEEWGRLDNNITVENHIDTGFVGRDGKIYLFCGEQFVRYTPAGNDAGTIPEFVDQNPQPIAEHWGGLKEISLAFVRDGKTYLLEKAGDDGQFRYLRYSGSDYSQPDPGYPQSADFSWWNIPGPYVEEGFEQVDAVLFEDEHMYLISGDRFIQYNQEQDAWTYPRPLERIWRGFPFNEDDFSEVLAAFTAPDGTVYFFADEKFTSYHNGTFGQKAGIRSRWGRVENHIVQRNRIDAAFVDAEGHTFLFCDDQYLRYSGSDYRFIDEGYPKLTVKHLREESAFQNLPQSFIERLEDLFAGEGRLGAVLGNPRTTYILEGQNCHAVSSSLTAVEPISKLGMLKNNIAETNRVDAAFVNEEGQTLIFSGDQYYRYSEADYQFVDEGYPKSLPANREGFPPWLKVDAVFQGRDGITYFFRDRHFVEVGQNADFTEQPIKGRWGARPNNFQSGNGGNVAIDAAFLAPDGRFYVFKGDQYLRYSGSKNEYADEGFPQPIRDNWGNLPPAYESGIDGAFVFDGKTYMIRREEGGYQYVRYSDRRYRAIDAIYPQTFPQRWGKWNDYLLSDIKTISRYKQLQEDHHSDEATLTDFFHDRHGDKKTPYRMLADIFGWDIDELKWLKQQNAFLYPENRFEVHFNLEMIIRMFDQFKLAGKMGTSPRELYQNVWMPLYQNGGTAPAADQLYQFLGLIQTEKDWQVLSRQLHDELNLIRRDALMPYVMTKLGLENSRDLYELLLIDPEMDCCGQTSRIKEAITAVQLYLHRFFVNLEQIEIAGELDDLKRRQLKQWWEWMKNYRVWEANRKVFLYPENYIRPELRDSKTPAFKTLEEELLQGEINDAAVTKAFKKYLDHYTEVSRLKIAGGYVYDDTNSAYEKQLILFGHTKTDPRQYYYRDAAFTGGDTNAAIWEPWREVNIQIDAKKVYPVFAFGRVFVFWARVETEIPDSNSTTLRTSESNGVQEISNEESVEYVLRVYFSFYNLNKEWMPPQTLDTQISPQRGDGRNGDGEDEAAIRALQMRERLPISNFKLFVENSEKLDDQTHENIVINCSYTAGRQPRNRAYILTPELYTKLTEKPNFSNAGINVFRSLFDSREVITESRVVSLNTFENSTDGPWYSFDHKGGSFLVKPAVPGLNQENVIQELSETFPSWPRIDAAFQAPDGTHYFFRNDEKKFVSSADLQDERDIASRWGRKQNAILSEQKVDAAFHDPGSGTTYLFRKNEFLTFTGQRYRWAEDRGPQAIDRNSAGFPRWKHIDAAFKGADGKRYFFRSDRKTFVTSDNLTVQLPTVSRWGRVKNSFTDPRKAKITGAFRHGNHTYLANGEEFIRYSGSSYALIDAGYPKSGGVKALLEDLGFTEVDAKFAKSIDGAYVNQNELLIHAHGQFTIRCDLGEKTITELNNNSDAFEAGYVNGNGQVQVLKSHDYDAAFVSDDVFYLFKNGEFMQTSTIPETFAAVLWQPTGRITEVWGREKNKLSQTGRVEAALQDGLKTYLFSGDEYYLYTASRRGKIGEFVDSGYPKKLSSNRDKLPKWNKLSAAFRGADGKTYFFNNDRRKYVVSGALDTEHDIGGKWGIIRSNVIEKGVDAAYTDQQKLYLLSGNEVVRYTADGNQRLPQLVDAGYPKTMEMPALPKFSRINAAFAYQGNVYLVSGDFFLRCPESNPYAVQPGYPKAGRLGDILEDLGFDSTPGQYANLPVHGSYVKGNDLFVHSHGHTLKCSITQKKITALNNSREYFEAGYINNSGQVQKLKDESYDAAVVAEGVFFLFKGDQYMRSESIPESFGEELSWEPSGKISDMWSINHAAFSLDGHIYLFMQDNYVHLHSGEEPAALTGIKPINGNWGNVPAEFKSGFDAALHSVDRGEEPGSEKLYLIKENRFIEYFLEEGRARPYEIETAEFDLIRLTTSTGYKLNRTLFAGGIEALLSLASQEIDEVPQFSTEQSGPAIIKYVDAKVNKVPISSHLDFFSANGLYYWEMFFHAPFLIAQSFNTGQKFEQARRWYEFIYDPTERSNYWKFLPFLTVDIEAIIESGRGAISELKSLGENMTEVENFLNPVFTDLQPYIEIFLGERDMTRAEKDYLESKDPRFLKGRLRSARQKLREGFNPNDAERINQLKTSLMELTQIIEMLWYRYELMETGAEQIQVYQDDPFDPHAIAGLRRIAYRKAIVMAYVDNLLDWGDMLFRQYSVESISEARMLYILAYDLLGRKPEGLGTRVLPEERIYGGPEVDDGIYNPSKAYEFLLDLESAEQPPASKLSFAATVHDSMINNMYFYIPDNELFVDYWERVEDRLHKIRHCLNIMGVKQPLPLFQPPIDPMAVVQAVGAGAPLSQVVGSQAVSIPHYRFTFMVNKAKELVQKLNQFGEQLLAAMEKRDAEELSIMQTKQEAVILDMTRTVREAQLGEVEETINSLQETQKNAKERITHFQRLISTGMNSYEQTQMNLMIAAAASQYASVVLKILGGIAYVIPEVTVGLFSFGAKTGGIHAGEALGSAAEGAQNLGEALSMTGEAIGMQAAFERMKEDWDLQKMITESEVKQLDAQLKGAEWQKKAARREIEILEKQIEQNESIKVFMKEKFTNQQLYQWMVSKLSGIYYQTYKLAHDMAKYAEQAYRFERGVPENEASFIQPVYWDGQKKGLLAGDSLGLDIDRMEQSFIESNARRLEISRNISLLELDPLALLELKTRGSCEFRLPESLFDYDFQGHYCRQIKTISLSFDMADGKQVNATLTQLGHHTILSPDPKAVKYLLNPKDAPPLSIRSDWRANQQIALSHTDEYDKNNGLFELRFDDERYLPFEGTGAVSNWRLTLNGKKGDYDVKSLTNVIINLKYTALQGGEAFAGAVRGLLKPYRTAIYFDLAREFPNEWNEFKNNGGELKVKFTREMFPNMSSSKIAGIFSQFDRASSGSLSLKLNGEEDLTLKDNQFLETSGLAISSRGSDWTFKVKGEKEILNTINLVITYKASVN